MTDQSVKMTSSSDMQAEPSSKREKILKAAVSVFSARGYRSTLVDEIAQEAGVAKGTLYLYFKSKEEIYLEAFRENVERLHEVTVRRIDEAHTTWDKIKAFIAARLEFGETNKHFLRIYLSEFVGSLTGREEWAKQLKTAFQRESDLLRAVFEKGIEAGEVREIPVEQLVSMLYYAVGGILMSRVTAIRLTEAQLDADMIVELLRKGLGTLGQ
ncbi:MAG: TetR/AcrR family transcriptional regulator [Acidobacteriota bacterium]